MSNFGDTHDQPVDHAVQPGSTAATSGVRRRSTGRRIAAVATGTTIALGAGGIAWAATGTPTPAPSSPSAPADPYATPTAPEKGLDSVPGDDGSPGWRSDGHGPGGVPFAGGPLGGVPLHGEQVVETSEGVYETIATQRGTVDAISATELTASSEDGFSRTYTLTADSLVDERTDEAIDLAVGDEVMVVATVEGTEATVTRAIDLDALPATTDGLPFHHGGPGGRGPGPGPEQAPNGSPEATPGATAKGSSA